NDSFAEADQYWGFCMVLSGLMNRELFQRPTILRNWFPNLSYLSIVVGGGLIFSSHPTRFSLFAASCVILVSRKMNLRFLKISKLKLAGFTTLLIAYPCLTYIELLRVAPAIGVREYETQTSIWDLFSGSDWVYRFQPVMAPIAAAVQPLLVIIGDAGTRTEFFNMILLMYLLVFFKRVIHGNDLRELQIWIRAQVIFLVFCLALSGIVARQQVPLISTLVSWHAWQIASSISAITLLASAIMLGRGQSNVLNTLFFRLWRIAGIVLALFYVCVMAFNKVDDSKFSVLRKFDRADFTEMPITRNERFVDSSVGSNDSSDEWSAIFGTRFELQLSRSGYPTIEFYGAGRHSSTLSNQFEKYRSGYVPNTADCRPEVLEFLAVSSIFVNTEDTSGCREKLIAYFGEDSEREINKVAGPPGTASLFRPKSFATWSIAIDSAENSSVSCPLLEQDCLKGLEVTKLPSTGQAPFRLCENDCLFTYKWAKTANTKQVLLPVNFDKTLEIEDSLTGKRLKTANYQGLLAVQVDGLEMSGVFTGNIRPDLMMWLRVAMTYLHTVVFLGALGAMLVKGVRVVKEISRDPESQPVS
ncbi:MAG: hypothetical protein ACKOAE_10060, partial [Acidimicrobiaceae bacterium]